MKFSRLAVIALSVLLAPMICTSGPSGGSISGKITFTGTAPKPKIVDMSKEPACVKLNPPPQFTQQVVTGTDKALQNVVVYLRRSSRKLFRPQYRCHL
jgi:hypothetical protein